MILFRVTLAFLLLLLLPDWYIYKVYVQPTGRRMARRLHWLPSAVLLAVLAGFLLLHERLNHEFGYYLIVMLCISVPKVVFTLTDLLLKGVRGLFRLPRFELPVALLAGIIGCVYVVYGAVWGKENFQVKEVTFCSPALPAAFDGYRILQISDLHIGSWKGNPAPLEEAVGLCNRQQPDVVLFTGDLVNSRADELPEFMPILSRLTAKDGVYSVLGNHDYGQYVRWNTEAESEANLDSLKQRERQMGWELLLNEHRTLYRDNDSIALVGVENNGRPPFPQRARLAEALQGTAGMFKVLMSHDPTHWRMEVLPDTDIHLTLAGHTHDMQISLFGWSVSQWIYPEHNGLYLQDGRGLHVNIGLGFVLFPMRLGAWPEITVITLRKQS